MSKKSWFSVALAGGVGEIKIFGEIGDFGITSTQFHAELSALKAKGVRTLLISVDSPGGDVTTGFAIANMISRYPGKKIARVDGIAASMASVILMYCDEVIMPSNAMLMIHEPWGGITGEAEKIKSFGDALETMKENIVGAYAKRTKLDPGHVREMMRAETWLSAQRAVELGFADRIEQPMKMAALVNSSLFNLGKFKNAPRIGHGLEALTPLIFEKFNRKMKLAEDGTRRYETKPGSKRYAIHPE